MQITPRNVKHGLVLAAIAVSTAGLNLGVLGLVDGERVAQAAVVTNDQPENTDPLQVVVEVPVIVPSSATTTADLVESTVVTNGGAGPGTDAPASVAQTPAPQAPASPTSAAPTSVTPTAPPTNPPPTKPVATTQAPTTTVAPSTTKAVTTTQVPATTQAPTTTTGAVTEYLYYDFSGVASQIIVAQHPDGSLEFWSVTTESGWGYKVEEDSANQVELKFSREPDGEGEAKWELTYSGGQLRVKKER